MGGVCKTPGPIVISKWKEAVTNTFVFPIRLLGWGWETCSKYLHVSFFVLIFFLRKKGDFRAFFLLFTTSVLSWPPGPPLVPGVFFSVFCFWPTSVKLPRVKICFPQYFGITRRYMQKKKILGNFFLPQKKRSFSRDFSRRPAFGRGAWTNP